jgi:glutamate 5-kinase
MPRRLVVKVGTSTLTDAAGRIDRSYVLDIATQTDALRKQGWDTTLVSSGAIQAGREAISQEICTLPQKQAAAAVGQSRLMHLYTEAFSWRSITVGQVLLTADDLADRRRFLNARNTLSALLALGVVPILNENDTVAVEEIRFGDNDTLAARVASLVDADLLLILSDVDGLHTAKPGSLGAERIPYVAALTPRLEQMAAGSGTPMGTGGMRTKLDAVRIASRAGIATRIAYGRTPNVLLRSVEGEDLGTLFAAGRSRLKGRRGWISAGTRTKGSIVLDVNAGGKVAAEGASILAVGIVAVQGAFEPGDVVEVISSSGKRIGRGMVNYSEKDLHRIKGLHSGQIAEILGYRPYDEVVHRDNLVLDD